MNGLEYLEKNEMNSELDKLVIHRLKLVKEQEGKKCPKCGFVQGTPLKGFQKYYCKCLRNKINRKLKKEKKEKGKKILAFVLFKLSANVAAEV